MPMAASTSIAAPPRRCSATMPPAARSISGFGAVIRYGARYGVEGGSFGYVNNYAIIGGRNERAEGTAFMSDVRGDGYISHSSFNTQTFNALGTYSLTPDDRITVKAIDNRLSTNLSTRLSLNQFQTNPLQRGCTNAAAAAPGCATVALFANGFSAPTVAQTADEAGFGRHDTRNIGGIRWEHDFDNQTTWRTQAVFDDKNITSRPERRAPSAIAPPTTCSPMSRNAAAFSVSAPSISRRCSTPASA